MTFFPTLRRVCCPSDGRLRPSSGWRCVPSPMDGLDPVNYPPPSLAVCTAIQTQGFSPAASQLPARSLARSRVLDAKRENPISAVTFCLCSGNIQGPYIKGRRGARRRGGSFNDSGEIMPSLSEGALQVIIPGFKPCDASVTQTHWNIGAAGGVTRSPPLPPPRGRAGATL